MAYMVIYRVMKGHALPAPDARMWHAASAWVDSMGMMDMICTASPPSSTYNVIAIGLPLAARDYKC